MLKCVPGLRMAYIDARLLWTIAYECLWCDRVGMNDQSHLTHEWNFEVPLERERYARILEVIACLRGPDNWGEVLEIGCAEGLFTEQLAPRSNRLVACDISMVACERTAERCRAFPQLNVGRLDLDSETISGQYDVVLAMDVLEFIHGHRRIQRVVEKLAGAVRPGGLLLVSICRLPEEWRHRWWMTLFPEGADNVLPYFRRRPDLRPVHEEEHQQAGESSGYIDHLIAMFHKIGTPVRSPHLIVR
jgi:2-polyprenyl-3-methyl-5-hydroxy-6-metoxy-1,4-benzoquinol methylase